MNRAEDGTIIVNSLEELISILRKKKEDTMYSVTVEHGDKQEGSKELPFPDLPSIETDDVTESISKEDDNGK